MGIFWRSAWTKELPCCCLSSGIHLHHRLAKNKFSLFISQIGHHYYFTIFSEQKWLSDLKLSYKLSKQKFIKCSMLKITILRGGERLLSLRKKLPEQVIFISFYFTSIFIHALSTYITTYIKRLFGTKNRDNWLFKLATPEILCNVLK